MRSVAAVISMSGAYRLDIPRKLIIWEDQLDIRLNRAPSFAKAPQTLAALTSLRRDSRRIRTHFHLRKEKEEIDHK